MPASIAQSSTHLLTNEPTTTTSAVMSLVDEMLQQLTEDELEIAARSSFAYTSDPTVEQHPEQQQREFAASLAQRYLDSKKGDVEKALKKLKATLQFRHDNAIDTSLRTTLLHDDTRLYKMLSTKKLYVAGRDRDGRSTYVFVPRRVQDHDLEMTRQAHLWTLEKAIANTRAKDGTINAVLDFADFDCVRQAPPLANGRDMLTLLRDHYVGRVHRIYFVNAPKSIHWLWSIFAPFAGTATKQKIVFVQKKQQQSLSDLYAADQVPSWFLQGGTWDDTFPVESFLSLPFDKLLGDK